MKLVYYTNRKKLLQKRHKIHYNALLEIDFVNTFKFSLSICIIWFIFISSFGKPNSQSRHVGLWRLFSNKSCDWLLTYCQPIINLYIKFILPTTEQITYHTGKGHTAQCDQNILCRTDNEQNTRRSAAYVWNSTWACWNRSSRE